MYLRILNSLALDHCDSVMRIRAALAADDRVTASREAHTLKGVAGNIGAGEVQDAAQQLEEAIEQQATSAALEEDLDTVLAKLVDGLQQLRSENVSAPTPTQRPASELRSAELLSKLERLQSMLEDYDGEAGELVAEIALMTAQTPYAQSMLKIGACADDYDFDEALELLMTLREELRATVNEASPT